MPKHSLEQIKEKITERSKKNQRALFRKYL